MPAYNVEDDEAISTRLGSVMKQFLNFSFMPETTARRGMKAEWIWSAVYHSTLCWPCKRKKFVSKMDLLAG